MWCFLWLIRQPTLRHPLYCKKNQTKQTKKSFRFILVSKRVTSLTSAISDLSDYENHFCVQDKRVILELVEVNYASNQREEWKDYFWKGVNTKNTKLLKIIIQPLEWQESGVFSASNKWELEPRREGKSREMLLLVTNSILHIYKYPQTDADKRKKICPRRQTVRHADEFMYFPAVVPLLHILFPSGQISMKKNQTKQSKIH